MNAIQCPAYSNWMPNDENCLACGDKEKCMSDTVRQIPIEQIDFTPDPARDANGDDILESVKTKGILEPLLCTYDEETERYKLIFGGRRLQAAKKAKLNKVLVRMFVADDYETRMLRLHENLHRQDYSPLAIAKELEWLRDNKKMKQKEIAQALGKSEAWVSMYLKSTKLPESVKEKVESGEVKIGADKAAQLARMDEKKAEKLVDGGATKEQVKKASKGRKLKYQWKHRGKVDGIGFTATLVFNDEDVEPTHIRMALEECVESI